MLEEFIAVDDNAPVTGELTDGEIVLKTLERKQPRTEVEEESVEAEDEEVEVATRMPSSSELLKILNTIRALKHASTLSTFMLSPSDRV